MPQHDYNASNAQTNWAAFVMAKLDQDVKALAEKYGMDAEKTYTFLTNALAIGVLSTSGEDFNKILPPMSMFAADDAIASYTAKKDAIIADLTALFDELRGIILHLGVED